MTIRTTDIEEITKAGQTYVQLPKEDYTALLEYIEDMEDIRTIEEAKTHSGETFPLELVGRLIEGENPIRVYREHRGMTQEKLAKAAGISRAYLAEIETSRKAGSISSLKAIAQALNVDLDDLV